MAHQNTPYVNLYKILTFCLLILANLSHFAQASNRVALLIANKDYQSSPLKNPVNDARLLERKLQNLNYEVKVVTNGDRYAMLQAIESFGQKANGADSAVFYFSGHGMQDKYRQNFLLPVNANITSEASIRAYGVEAHEVINVLNQAKPRVGLVIFDACRNNPFAGVRGNRNFAVQPVDVSSEILVSYATKNGQYAKDGSGNNSPFAIAVAEQLDKASRVPLLTMFDNVKRKVKKLTNNEQQPTRMGDAETSTYLIPALLSDTGLSGGTQLNENLVISTEQLAWQVAQQSNSITGYKAYLSEYPNGKFAAVARIALASMRDKPNRITTAPSQTSQNTTSSGSRIGSFTVYPNGTARDNDTGLMWPRCLDAFTPWRESGCAPIRQYIKISEIDNKIAEINAKNYLGYNDWRFATIEELATLIHCKRGYKKKVTIPLRNGRTKTTSSHCENGWALMKKNAIKNSVVFPSAEKLYQCDSNSTIKNNSNKRWFVIFFGGEINWRKVDDLFSSNEAGLCLVRGILNK